MIYSNIIDLRELEKLAMTSDKNLENNMDRIINKRKDLYEKIKQFDIESLN